MRRSQYRAGGMGQNGGIGAAEVAGEDHPAIVALATRESKQDKTRSEDMPGVAQLEGDSLLLREKGFMQLKAPPQLIDKRFQATDNLFPF